MEPVSPVSLERPELQAAEFKFGAGQPEYKELPGLRHADQFGRVTTRWELTWSERFQIFFTGFLWLNQLTFHRPLQPVSIDLEEPTFDIVKAYGRRGDAEVKA